MASENIDIIYNFVDKSGSGISSALGGITRLGTAAGKIAVTSFAAFGAAAAAAGAAAIKLGSDAQEMQGKFDVVFASTGGAVTDALSAFADEVGRGKFELMGFASTIGDTLKPLGFAEEAAASMSVDIVKLATDLGSFNNISTDEALQRLQGGLIGNHENLQTFGVRINEAVLKEEMMRLGTDRLTGAALEAAKVTARWGLILRGTTDAQGDAARTSDSFANQMRRLSSTIFQAGSEIGLSLLPMVTPLVTKLGELANIGALKLVPVFEDIGEAFTRFFDLSARGMPIVANVRTLIDRLGEAVGLSPEVTARLSNFAGVVTQMFVDISNGESKVVAATNAFKKLASQEDQDRVRDISQSMLDFIASTSALGEQQNTIALSAATHGAEAMSIFGQLKSQVEEINRLTAETDSREAFFNVLEMAGLEERITSVQKSFFSFKSSVVESFAGVQEKAGEMATAVEDFAGGMATSIENAFIATVSVIATAIAAIIAMVTEGAAAAANLSNDAAKASGGFGDAATKSGGTSAGGVGVPGRGAGRPPEGVSGNNNTVTNNLTINTNASSANVQNEFSLMSAMAGGI